MHRREILAGLAASMLSTSIAESQEQPTSNTYLELRIWRLHNSQENQGARLSEYLHTGLMAALARAGAKFAGAFGNVIGQDGPYYVTLAEFRSLKAFQDVQTALHSDSEHQRELDKLSSANAIPFVRMESSLLRSFDVQPHINFSGSGEKPRIFEMRTYESQSFVTLRRKVQMFNEGEAQIFQRLGMKPVFFGETIVGPRQPNLTYMLSYDDLAAREKLWSAFGGDPEWQKLKSKPGLSDPEIVANISNVILRPLSFSPIR